MALYSRIHSWVTGEVLTASDLNAEFNNVLTNSKSDSIIGTSGTTGAMQTTVDPGGVGSESLASNVTGELQRLRYMVGFLASGNANNWYDRTGRSLAANSLAVTKGDMASLGQQVSASAGSFSTTNNSPTDVTNLSVTITTTGRPVYVGLISDGVPSVTAIFGVALSGGATSTGGQAFGYIVRDGSIIGTYTVGFGTAVSNTGKGTSVPASVINTIDLSAPAGTHTYKVQIQGDGTATASCLNCKLIAYEIA